MGRVLRSNRRQAGLGAIVVNGFVATPTGDGSNFLVTTPYGTQTMLAAEDLQSVTAAWSAANKGAGSPAAAVQAAQSSGVTDNTIVTQGTGPQYYVAGIGTINAGSTYILNGKVFQLARDGTSVQPGTVDVNGAPYASGASSSAAASTASPVSVNVTVVSRGTGPSTPITDVAGGPVVTGGSLVAINGQQYQVSSSGRLAPPGSFDSNGNVPYNQAPGGQATVSQTSAAASSGSSQTAPVIQAGQTYHYTGYAIVIQSVGNGGPGLQTDEGVKLPIGTVYKDTVDGSIWTATGPNTASQVVNQATSNPTDSVGTTPATVTPTPAPAAGGSPTYPEIVASGSGFNLQVSASGPTLAVDPNSVTKNADGTTNFKTTDGQSWIQNVDGSIASASSSIPSWLWLVGGAAVLLIVMKK